MKKSEIPNTRRRQTHAATGQSWALMPTTQAWARIPELRLRPKSWRDRLGLIIDVEDREAFSQLPYGERLLSGSWILMIQQLEPSERYTATDILLRLKLEIFFSILRDRVFPFLKEHDLPF